MFDGFSLRHVPALLAGTSMTFGGMWPFFDARGAMLEFGHAPHVAESTAAARVMVSGNARTTVLGFIMLLFYSRGQLEDVDTVLAWTGLWAGLVDSWVVWREGQTNKAVFRLASSLFLSACGFAGLTAGR